MPEAEVEVEVEEEEDLKQEENVLKEEEDQMYQINLKGGRGPIFTQEQEREIINMVLANNAIRLREIQANIIGDHAIFNNVHQVSQSTLARILKRHQVQMKQLLSVLYFQIFFPLFFTVIVTCTGYRILRLSDIC